MWLLDRYRRLSLGAKIVVFMAAGILAGLGLGESAVAFEPLGTLFIRLLMMAAIPLVFFNLLAAVGSMTDVKLLGRLGVKILVYYTLTTVVAIRLGLATTAWLRPGDGMKLPEAPPDGLGSVPSVGEVLLDLVPTNVVDSFARGNVGQIVFFSVLLGFATALLPEEHRKPLDGLFSAAAELFRKLVALILRFGPIGIGALAAATVGQYGSGLFGPLARFLASVWLAQAFVVALYLAFVLYFGRTSPFEFLKKTGPLYATTAATCSSLASLAVSLELAEKRLKLPRAVYSFTLPLGAQFNKDGTAVMLGSVLLFTSQSAGIGLDGAAMASVLALGLVLSQSSSGIPGGGLVSALLLVEALRLPVELAAVVGGIYRLVDRAARR
ncbi:MAG TPA: dicarboxylate/amino acid:cation symporter [Vicinamibacteria bacterium]|nr:dicarboxylate/amino acid:cation symporter [Vicinamibacteria bacterium]